MNYPRGRLRCTISPPLEILIEKDRIIPPSKVLDFHTLAIRDGGEFAGLGWYLAECNEYDWVIVRDDGDSLVLLRLKKE